MISLPFRDKHILLGINFEHFMREEFREALQNKRRFTAWRHRVALSSEQWNIVGSTLVAICILVYTLTALSILAIITLLRLHCHLWHCNRKRSPPQAPQRPRRQQNEEYELPPGHAQAVFHT